MRAVPRFKKSKATLQNFLFEKFEPYGVAVINEAGSTCAAYGHAAGKARPPPLAGHHEQLTRKPQREVLLTGPVDLLGAFW